MKLFKKLFGSNPKEISKYEPNTLAEINESPDMRNNNAEEETENKADTKNKIAIKSQKATANESKSVPAKSSDTKKKVDVKSAKKEKTAPSNSTKPAAKPTKKPPVEFDNEIKVVTTGIDNEALTGSKEVGKALSKKLLKDIKDQVKVTENKADKDTQKAEKATVKKSVEEKKAPVKDTKKSTTEAKTASKVSKAAAEESKTVAKKTTSKAASENSATDSKTQTKTATNKSDKESKSLEKATTKKTATESKTAANANKKSVASPKNTEVKKDTTSTRTASKIASKPQKTASANIDTDNTGIDEVTEIKATRTGKFEIKKSKDGRYVFNLYASNNVIVATSQIYSSASSAMNGIKSVVANASSAPVEDQTVKNYTAIPFPKWEIYKDKGEQFRFRLSASNGSCVCHSQGYTSKTNCKKGIESIIKFATDAEITKAYINKDK